MHAFVTIQANVNVHSQKQPWVGGVKFWMSSPNKLDIRLFIKVYVISVCTWNTPHLIKQKSLFYYLDNLKDELSNKTFISS